MTRSGLLGLDLGTTAIKATLCDLDGIELAHARRPTPWMAIAGGAEADPEALFSTALDAIVAVLADHPDVRPLGIGITSMAETGVLLDGHGAPLAPFVAWHDTRARSDAESLGRDLGGRWFSERTGLILRARVSAAQIHWSFRHLPGASTAARWLGVAEWVAHRLGAPPVADMSLAARTGFLDLERRAWLTEVVDWAGAPRHLLPDLVPSGRPLGRVGSQWPQLEGAVITLAGHDHLCAAVGAGAVSDDDTFDSCGTAEALVRAIPPPVAGPVVGDAVARGLAVGWHVLPERQTLLGGMPTGRALLRVLSMLGVSRTHARARRRLDRAALAAGDPSPLTFAGIMDETATLEGIDWTVDRGRIWRAAVDAVTEHAAALLFEMERIAGHSARVVVGGGWVHNPVLMASKRNRIGAIVIPKVTEPGARGAALVAGVAAGQMDFAKLPAPAFEAG